MGSTKNQVHTQRRGGHLKKEERVSALIVVGGPSHLIIQVVMHTQHAVEKTRKERERDSYEYSSIKIAGPNHPPPSASILAFNCAPATLPSYYSA